jgi:hypothetical protein
MSASGRAVLEVLGRRDDLDLAVLDFAVAVADMAGYHPFGHEIMSSFASAQWAGGWPILKATRRGRQASAWK